LTALADDSSPGSWGTGPSITSERFRAVLGHFASGVTVVTATSEGGPVGFTAQAFIALSLDPPLVVTTAQRTSQSWPRIESVGAFAVNVLAEGQETLARTFAVSGVDKFTGVGWEPAPVTGAPLLEGALAWVECRLERTYDGGDHVIVAGRVLDLAVRGEGKPLLFYRGGFGRFEV